MRDLAKLKSAQAAILADQSLQPVKDAAGNIIETHCNFGAERVAREMGCLELDGMVADDQYATMARNASKLWAKVSGQTAAAHAMAGGLAFAAMTAAQLGDAHGHIASISPEPMQWSGSLGKDVPMVVNIGRVDTDEKESMAFPVAKGEPSYFTYDAAGE
jgi:hypothetical protein